MRSIRSASLAVLVLMSTTSSALAAQTPNAGAPTLQVAPDGPRRVAGALPKASTPNALSPLARGSAQTDRSVPDRPNAVLQDQQSDRGRNVLIGAVLGAVAGAVVTASVCGDSEGLCIFSPAILFPIGGAAAGMLIALLLTPVR